MAIITVDPKDSKEGFEAASGGNMPWQLLEKGGARGLIIKGADNHDFQVWSADGNPGGLTFSETRLNTTKHREIWLQGHSQGNYSFEFINPSSGAAVYFISVNVVNVRAVKTMFYYLPGVRQRFNVEMITKGINAIWNRTANVRVVSLGMMGNPNGETLDIHERKISVAETSHRVALMNYGNHAAADWHVYLGWGVNGDAAAETLGDRTVIDILRRKDSELHWVAHTLAHELGHHICRQTPSHDTQTGDLMLEETKNGKNNKVRKNRALMVIRSTP